MTRSIVYVIPDTNLFIQCRPLAARGELAVLGAGDCARLAAGAGAGRLILVAGRPLEEPVARYGPFVMNTADEIRKAVLDFQAGRF